MVLKLQNTFLLASMIVLSFALAAVPAFAYDCSNPITNLQKWYCERAESLQQGYEQISNLEAPSVNPYIEYLTSTRGFPRYGNYDYSSIRIDNSNGSPVTIDTSYYGCDGERFCGSEDNGSDGGNEGFVESEPFIPQPLIPPVTHFEPAPVTPEPEPVAPPAEDYSAYDYSGYWYY